MVRRSRSIPLPEPASLTNSPPASLRPPATLRVALRAGEALRAGPKICERRRLTIDQRPVTHFLRAILMLVLLIACRPLSAQPAVPYRADFPGSVPQLSAGAQVSLITYSPGEELYEAFGHSAIRIRDDLLDIDRLYNFGVFDFDTPNFYLKFAHGELLYQLAVSDSEAETQAVEASGGGVTELLLDLSPAQRQALFEALEINLLPQNRFYEYDFLLDNCATRPRDAIEKVTGSPVTLQNTGNETFRQMLDPYFTRMPWIGFGLSLLLGANVDRPVTPREACFLPANLERAVESSKNEGHNLVAERKVICSADPLPATPGYLAPVCVFYTGGALWFLFWLVRKKGHATWLTASVLMVFGLVGLFILVFSFWTRNWVAHENYNILWLIPFHLPAGLGLLLANHRSLALRWYLWLALLAGTAFLIFSFLLPQHFSLAVYPLVLLLVWRCAVELFPDRKVVPS
jgi:hypothetical protein